LSKRNNGFLEVYKARRIHFPHGGGRGSELYVNDHELEENNRRMRVDPLKDGYDPDRIEDPRKEIIPSKKPDDFPI